MMARIAALSGTGSFPQAVTTWDRSCPNATGFCEAICDGESVFAKLALDLSRVRAPPLPPLFYWLCDRATAPARRPDSRAQPSPGDGLESGPRQSGNRTRHWARRCNRLDAGRFSGGSRKGARPDSPIPPGKPALAVATAGLPAGPILRLEQPRVGVTEHFLLWLERSPPWFPAGGHDGWWRADPG